MRTLLIVWWSSTGAARALAESAASAARQSASGVRVRCVRCDQVQAVDLIEADGLLFACPEMLGSMAGMMKDFFDRTYYPVLDRLAGRPYALIVSAGSDGQGAIRQLERVASGWRLRSIAPPLLIGTRAQSPEAILAPKTLPTSALDQAAERGAALASGLELGLW